MEDLEKDMSRGLGRLQQAVIKTLLDHADENYAWSIWGVQCEIFGTRPRLRLDGHQVIAEGRLINYGPKANLHRAIRTLQKRELITKWDEYHYSRRLPYIGLTEKALSDYLR